MTQQTVRRRNWREIAPVWVVLALFLLVSLGVYAFHLATGVTPDRVALRIPFLDFDVYWYGILITGGIALGAYTTSRLALERGRALLRKHVPAGVRQRSLATLNLPDEIEQILKQRDVTTLGALLLRWGFDPRTLGLNDDGQEVVREKLTQASGVKPAWIEDAPWRIWNPDHVWNGVLWCLVLAVVGARLYHVLTPSPSMAAVGIESPMDYFRNPLQLINLRRGGLGIYGGIAGGLLGLVIFAYRARIPPIAWADIAAPGVALGQVIGRWGNFVNQELYGRPTDLPWAVQIDEPYRLPGYTEFSQFHPAFLYESLWNLLAFVVLITLARRYRDRLKTGDLMAAYLILYGVGRTLMETVRLDSRTVTLGGLDTRLPVATLVSLVLAVVMGGWLAYRHLGQR